jgi:hypothetical protein
MPSHRYRVDQVVRQQLYSATTTCGGFGHRCRADGLRVLDLRGANDHLQSRFWLRGGLLSPVIAAASPAATSISSGAPPTASRVSGVKLSTGTADGMSFPSASVPVNEKTSASVLSDAYDYSSGILQPQQSTYLRLRWLQAT